MKGKTPTPASVLMSHKVKAKVPIYIVGSFDQNVTVLSQQIRALNLVYALTETSTVPSGSADRLKIAVVGAGFAGLTLTAALLRKRSALNITLFEERDTLLPLQQGCDSRWLHPQIYDWPAEGSEASASMMPVLNWTAGRASDVAAQVISEWARVVQEEKPDENHLRLFCNTRHLQIEVCSDDESKARIEWVGECRKPMDGTGTGIDETKGSAEIFDLVVVTAGFGIEPAAVWSYWRNETLGQPNLHQNRVTYLLSGQGDGAMIDLLRIRISQYRQDRILEELFGNKPNLQKELKNIYKKFASGSIGGALFGEFEALGSSSAQAKAEVDRLQIELKDRLRRDTDVVLKLKVRNLAKLFDGQVRISFQNALLVYFLYKSGGFAPSVDSVEDLTQRLGLKTDHIVRRHGPDRLKVFERLFSEALYKILKKGYERKTTLRQKAEIYFPGGYFGTPGRLADISSITDEERKTWRKEYLPGPTQLVANVICGAIVGAISDLQHGKNFRVTLHRVLKIHNVPTLQQSCDYLGPNAGQYGSAAGRVFPTTHATIGLAYSCRRIVRSLSKVDPGPLKTTMEELDLTLAARQMRNNVRFVLAIPILQSDCAFLPPSPVSGVIYVDSDSDDFWLSDDHVRQISWLIKCCLEGLLGMNGSVMDRIRNVRTGDPMDSAPPPNKLPSAARAVLDLLHDLAPPVTRGPFNFNFEHSDLTPITRKMEDSNAPKDMCHV